MSAPAVSYPKLPAVDSRLVAPGSGYEIEEGRVRKVVPADEPHGTRHSKLSALLEAHVGEAYEAASDMLTRSSPIDDMAPDASVFPRERDPETGGRKLEELAFEVTNTKSLNDVGSKARKLVLRGVRRVFAIDTARQRAYEWSQPLDAWRLLEREGAIADDALAVPLSVEDLVHAAKVDDAVARALLAKGNPVLETALANSHDRGKRDGKIEGRTEGKIEAVLAVLKARDFAIDGATQERIGRERDNVVLDRWLALAATCTSVSAFVDALGERAPDV